MMIQQLFKLEFVKQFMITLQHTENSDICIGLQRQF